jgi:hypothetical protein
MMSSITSTRRVGIATVAIAGAVVSMAAVAGGATAAPHMGARPAVAMSFSVGAVGLDSTALKVKGAHGRTLYLTVSAEKHPGIGMASLSVELSTSPHFGAGESHTWSFTLKPSVLSYNSGAGRGTLSTGRALKSFGSLKLSFRKRSQSTGSCDPNDPSVGKQIQVTGRLAGRVFFNTGSVEHGWGSVGSHKHSLTFHAPDRVFLVEKGCPAGFGNGASCFRGLFWSGPFVNIKGGGTSVSGTVAKVGSRTESTISFDRFVTLHHPLKAQRIDTLTVREPSPTLHAGLLTITTKGRLITGSAMITSTSSLPNSYGCMLGRKQRTQKNVDYSGTWAGKRLTANFTATGRATTPATSSKVSFTTESF